MENFLQDIYHRLIRTFYPVRYKKMAILASSRYDMYKEPSEAFFSEIYLHFIQQDLREFSSTSPISILDVGCGQGRLSIPLAKEGHRVMGIDISSDALKKGRQYADEQKVSIQFKQMDLTDADFNIMNQQFDCLVCTEMIYMVDNPEGLIEKFQKMVKPNGIIIISFRTRLYYLFHAIMHHSWGDVEMIAKDYSGELNGITFNWFTKEKISEIFFKKGICPKKFRAIGIFSGIEGDPQSCFSIPSTLTDRERAQLMSLEILMAEEFPESGRYIYCSGINENK